MVEQKEPESAASSYTVATKTHHVLMVAFSAQGHINPLLRLGMLLQSKGLQVTLASTQFTHQRLLERFTTTTDTTTTPNSDSTISISGIRFEFFSDGTNLENPKEIDVNSYFNSLEKFGPGNLSKLIRDLQIRGDVPKFSCIINNPFVPWVAEVAEEHGIPCAMLWIQPCSLYSIYYRFYNNLNTFPSFENPEIDAVELPGLPLLRTCDLPSFVLPSNPFTCFAEILSKALQTHKIKWVLANSFYELESEVIDAILPHTPIKTVGPLVPPSLLVKHQSHHYDSRRCKSMDNVRFDMWKADEDCVDWLDQMPPRSVIYISFGSFATLPKESMESIAIALKNTKTPFLWVAKPPEIKASEGANQVPDGFLEETKEQGRVVSWCPQSQVLSHPSLACFLTHCGWNSTLESICAGVPLICYPLWTDQPTNAKFVVDVFEIGVRLWPDKEMIVDSKDIEKCIEEITIGSNAARIRENAAGWKRAAGEAAASGGSSDRNIQWFVDEIVRASY